ncbi:MAG TPA: hypothetical protein VH743_24025 [Beijerinckiaceae bacterium]
MLTIADTIMRLKGIEALDLVCIAHASAAHPVPLIKSIDQGGEVVRQRLFQCGRIQAQKHARDRGRRDDARNRIDSRQKSL